MDCTSYCIPVTGFIGPTSYLHPAELCGCRPTLQSLLSAHYTRLLIDKQIVLRGPHILSPSHLIQLQTLGILFIDSNSMYLPRLVYDKSRQKANGQLEMDGKTVQ